MVKKSVAKKTEASGTDTLGLTATKGQLGVSASDAKYRLLGTARGLPTYIQHL